MKDKENELCSLLSSAVDSDYYSEWFAKIFSGEILAVTESPVAGALEVLVEETGGTKKTYAITLTVESV